MHIMSWRSHYVHGPLKSPWLPVPNLANQYSELKTTSHVFYTGTMQQKALQHEHLDPFPFSSECNKTTECKNYLLLPYQESEQRYRVK